MGEQNGGKTVGELIGEDAKIEWEKMKGTVTGTIKNISDYGEPYEEGQRNGHFFPIKFAGRYYGKNVTVGSQNGQGGKQIKPTADDPYLIIRVENVTIDNKISAILTDTKEEIFELDFSKAILAED